MKHRELWWLLVVIGVIAAGFYRAGKVDVPEPAPSSSAVAVRALSPSPSSEVPRFRGPLSRAQFSFEMVPAYGTALPQFRFRVRGTKEGALVTASMSRDGRTAHHDTKLSAEAWRSFFDRMEDRGVWALRSNYVETDRYEARCEVYVQAADWTHRAIIGESTADLHVAAFLCQGLGPGSLFASEYWTLDKQIAFTNLRMNPEWLYDYGSLTVTESSPEPSASPTAR